MDYIYHLYNVYGTRPTNHIAPRSSQNTIYKKDTKRFPLKIIAIIIIFSFTFYALHCCSFLIFQSHLLFDKYRDMVHHKLMQGDDQVISDLEKSLRNQLSIEIHTSKKI